MNALQSDLIFFIHGARVLSFNAFRLRKNAESREAVQGVDNLTPEQFDSCNACLILNCMPVCRPSRQAHGGRLQTIQSPGLYRTYFPREI